jgi:predicted DNA-binding WGR domain protein
MELGRYEYVGGSSNKYWHVVHDQNNNVYVATWGRIGNRNPGGSKQYSAQEIRKKIIEKRKKGYVKVDGYEERVGNLSVHFIKESA